MSQPLEPDRKQLQLLAFKDETSHQLPRRMVRFLHGTARRGLQQQQVEQEQLQALVYQAEQLD
jgi:hypothetical protein